VRLAEPENRPVGVRCGRQCCAVNEVRPELDELLFSSLENVLVESVEATDMVVRIEVLSTVRQATCPGCGYLPGRIHGSYLRSFTIYRRRASPSWWH
jgi:hypothetical protein